MFVSPLRRNCLFLCLVGVFSAMCACQPQGDSQLENKPITSFFDLENYFQKEIARLQQLQPGVNKKIILNGKVEQQALDSIDFMEELSVFSKSAINRPSWSDQYRVDSTFYQEKLASLHYEALNDRLKTRKLDIAFSKGQVSEIKVENLLETVIATTEQKLHYQPELGYSIHNMQEIAFSKAQELDIVVLFEAP